MYIALRSFFAVPRCRVTKVTLSQIHYVLVPQLLLQMDIIYPNILQAVHYFKEYSFIAPVWRVFTFTTLYVCMVANIVYISRGLCMVAKSV